MKNNLHKTVGFISETAFPKCYLSCCFAEAFSIQRETSAHTLVHVCKWDQTSWVQSVVIPHLKMKLWRSGELITFTLLTNWTFADCSRCEEADRVGSWGGLAWILLSCTSTNWVSGWAWCGWLVIMIPGHLPLCPPPDTRWAALGHMRSFGPWRRCLSGQRVTGGKLLRGAQTENRHPNTNALH